MFDLGTKSSWKASWIRYYLKRPEPPELRGRIDPHSHQGRCLFQNHKQNHDRPWKGRTDMAQASECGTHHGQNLNSHALEWRTLRGNQRHYAVSPSRRERISNTY